MDDVRRHTYGQPYQHRDRENLEGKLNVLHQNLDWLGTRRKHIQDLRSNIASEMAAFDQCYAEGSDTEKREWQEHKAEMTRLSTAVLQSPDAIVNRSQLVGTIMLTGEHEYARQYGFHTPTPSSKPNPTEEVSNIESLELMDLREAWSDYLTSQDEIRRITELMAQIQQGLTDGTLESLTEAEESEFVYLGEELARHKRVPKPEKNMPNYRGSKGSTTNGNGSSAAGSSHSAATQGVPHSDATQDSSQQAQDNDLRQAWKSYGDNQKRVQELKLAIDASARAEYELIDRMDLTVEQAQAEMRVLQSVPKPPNVPGFKPLKGIRMEGETYAQALEREEFTERRVAERKARVRAENAATGCRVPAISKDLWDWCEWDEVQQRHVDVPNPPRTLEERFARGPYWCPKDEWNKWRWDATEGWISILLEEWTHRQQDSLANDQPIVPLSSSPAPLSQLTSSECFSITSSPAATPSPTPSPPHPQSRSRSYSPSPPRSPSPQPLYSQQPSCRHPLPSKPPVQQQQKPMVYPLPSPFGSRMAKKLSKSARMALKRQRQKKQEELRKSGQQTLKRGRDDQGTQEGSPSKRNK
ncbi:hypothetical protein BGX31_003622, partial [Mortierella sp. GBA43]